MKKDRLSYEGYRLVFEDRFEGETLNRDNWNVELHEPGWVNEELQRYVDSEENIFLRDGKLVLRAIETVGEDGSRSYTSGRINTRYKHDFTYGIFEARLRVPAGKGFLPAFWLLATEEDGVHGSWPVCGEIDIMEVKCDDTKVNYGTIHYGLPHEQNQGSIALEQGSFDGEFHDFALLWEPDVLRWYVDGKLYHEARDWYSVEADGKANLYPAPFDHNMNLILNLAVGGSWVGYPDETTDFENAVFEVDAVRVYQKEGQS